MPYAPVTSFMLDHLQSRALSSLLIRTQCAAYPCCTFANGPRMFTTIPQGVWLPNCIGSALPCMLPPSEVVGVGKCTGSGSCAIFTGICREEGVILPISALFAKPLYASGCMFCVLAVVEQPTRNKSMVDENSRGTRKLIFLG